MPSYRKRPIIVEAAQFFPDRKPWPPGVRENTYRHAPGSYYVVTIHRQFAYLDPGDWVIAESDGEHYYPCKPDEFERIYEPVAETIPDRPPGPPSPPMPKCALCGHSFRDHNRQSGGCRACTCNAYGDGRFA